MIGISDGREFERKISFQGSCEVLGCFIMSAFVSFVYLYFYGPQVVKPLFHLQAIRTPPSVLPRLISFNFQVLYSVAQ